MNTPSRSGRLVVSSTQPSAAGCGGLGRIHRDNDPLRRVAVVAVGRVLLQTSISNMVDAIGMVDLVNVASPSDAKGYDFDSAIGS